jgi:hypothetical protein
MICRSCRSRSAAQWPRAADGSSSPWLEVKARWATPVAVLFYSFGPIPSNELFIAAGLSRMRLAPVVVAFFAGRVVSYTLWAATADKMVDRIQDSFFRHWGSVSAIGIELLALAVLVVLTRVDWPRLLPLPAAPTMTDRCPDRMCRHRRPPRPRRRGTIASSPSAERRPMGRG